MFRTVFIRLFSAIALTFAVVGCDKAEKSIVRGSVTLDGVALADAEVRFVPKNNPDLGTAQAKTDANGSFTIQPDANNNNLLRPGEFNVLISKVVQTDPKGGMGTPTVNLVPPQYDVQAETPLKAELKNGENKLATFELVGAKK